jgi:hypothetical protein
MNEWETTFSLSMLSLRNVERDISPTDYKPSWTFPRDLAHLWRINNEERH